MSTRRRRSPALTTATSSSTATRATTGIVIATSDRPAADPASPVDTTGLPIPAVIMVEAPRSSVVPVWTTAAAVPPPTAAKAQPRSGVAVSMFAAATTMPAVTAAGIAATSRTLSSQGM